MNMTRRTLKSRTITIDDYYSERFLHIETELRHQRDLIKLGFETMEKRFEASDKRFEASDKRFEALHAEMNMRFEYLANRIDRFMKWSFGMTLTSAGVIIAAMKMLK
jgi:hypothetical protein